ncbi:hypothetical protein FOIG_16849 [Fusarium odoratissimum NRRL 54006]|uniref:Uncharacterized protein n=1 Tax=Fusarium odoratissimum (strain NRRL 54006) TaxID=1089451 RepID=X0ILV8_FUSO5|nr:uncharacterized protein FOIG_16849 [Fusarium odoratissimum NRRL 54006]EXL89868.1 hypothetical protein FOIG_16849 [Fusarium odoratissimum NRRL 54006]
MLRKGKEHLNKALLTLTDGLPFNYSPVKGPSIYLISTTTG